MSEKRQATEFAVADYLDSDEGIIEYLSAVMELDDSALFTKALGDIARAKGMTAMARDTGVTRDGLYKALSASGNPSYALVAKVLKAMGLCLVPAKIAHC